MAIQSVCVCVEVSVDRVDWQISATERSVEAPIQAYAILVRIGLMDQGNRIERPSGHPFKHMWY